MKLNTVICYEIMDKFAGPAAQGRVRSCCDWLFNSISLINGPPQGAWVTYLPYSTPFGKAGIAADDFQIRVFVLFCRPGGVQETFLRA